MFFDHKTRKFYGTIWDITPEEEAYLNEQVAKGIMVSTEHPSDEEIEAVLKYQSEHAFNEGLEELLKKEGLIE